MESDCPTPPRNRPARRRRLVLARPAASIGRGTSPHTSARGVSPPLPAAVLRPARRPRQFQRRSRVPRLARLRCLAYTPECSSRGGASASHSVDPRPAWQRHPASASPLYSFSSGAPPSPAAAASHLASRLLSLRRRSLKSQAQRGVSPLLAASHRRAKQNSDAGESRRRWRARRGDTRVQNENAAAWLGEAAAVRAAWDREARHSRWARLGAAAGRAAGEARRSS